MLSLRSLPGWGLLAAGALLSPWDDSAASSGTSWPCNAAATAHCGQGSSYAGLGVSGCTSEQEAVAAPGEL